MKNLIIIRHGSYAKNSGKLNEAGLLQITNLSKVIATDMSIAKTQIISSTAPQAMHSAELLSQKLVLTYKTDSVFCIKNNHGANIFKAVEKMVEVSRNMDIDTIILITHLEYCSELAISVPYNQKMF